MTSQQDSALTFFLENPLFFGKKYFPNHFRDESPAFHLKILDELYKHKELLKENDLVFQCIDNWEALKLNEAEWPKIFVERIERAYREVFDYRLSAEPFVNYIMQRCHGPR